MAFFPTTLCLVSSFCSIFAQIVFNDDGTVPEGSHAKFFFQSLNGNIHKKLIAATTNYILEREDKTKFAAMFDIKSKGISCLFTIRLDNTSKNIGTIRVMSIAEGITPIEVAELNIQGPKPGFTYAATRPYLYAKNAGNDWLTYKQAFGEGKKYVSDTVVEKLKALCAIKKYTRVGFSTCLINGSDQDGNGTGVYLFFAVFFSEE